MWNNDIHGAMERAFVFPDDYQYDTHYTGNGSCVEEDLDWSFWTHMTMGPSATVKALRTGSTLIDRFHRVQPVQNDSVTFR